MEPHCRPSSARCSICNGPKHCIATSRYKWAVGAGAAEAVVAASRGNDQKTLLICSSCKPTSCAISTKPCSNSLRSRQRSVKWTKRLSVSSSWPTASSRRTSACSAWRKRCVSAPVSRTPVVVPVVVPAAAAVAPAVVRTAAAAAARSAIWPRRPKKKRVDWSVSHASRTTPTSPTRLARCSRQRMRCDGPRRGRPRRAARRSKS